MKKSQALILLTSLAVSSVAFAASGGAPVCTKGALNMEIYVKDVDSCPDDKAHAEYCIYDTSLRSPGSDGTVCEDNDNSIFFKNTNESYSFRKSPKAVHITHHFGSRINGVIKVDRLHFDYEHGAVSDNCSEIFGPDVKCVITESGSSKHPLYKLTISKNS